MKAKTRRFGLMIGGIVLILAFIGAIYSFIGALNPINWMTLIWSSLVALGSAVSIPVLFKMAF